MSPLLMGTSAVSSLLFLAALALAMMRKVRNAREDGSWLMRAGARILATITDVQIRRGWKEGERWEQSPWDGGLVALRRKRRESCLTTQRSIRMQ